MLSTMTSGAEGAQAVAQWIREGSVVVNSTVQIKQSEDAEAIETPLIVSVMQLYLSNKYPPEMLHVVSALLDKVQPRSD